MSYFWKLFLKSELFHLLCCSALLKLVSSASAGEGDGSLIVMIVILTKKVILSMLCRYDGASLI